MLAPYSAAPANALHQGVADLTLALRQGRTRLARCRTRPPLVVQRALYPDEALPDMAFVYLANPSGGLFQGDQIDVSVQVASGAKAHVTTQNATKVYTMPGGAAHQSVSLSVADDGYLEYMPDAIIPFKDAHLVQETTIEVAPGGTLLYWEIIAPGRVAMGESFDYTRLTNRLTVQGHLGQPTYREAYSLSPKSLSPLGLGVLGREPADSRQLPTARTLGSMLILANVPGVGPLLEKLQDAVRSWNDVKAGVGRLPQGDGLAVKVIGAETATVQRALTRSWSLARKQLMGKDVPSLRKY